MSGLSGCEVKLTGLAVRQSVKVDNAELESRLQRLQEEIVDLKEKDRLHLAETKKCVLRSHMAKSS